MPITRLRTVILLVCLAVLTACQSAPRARVEAGGVEFRAERLEDAERVSSAYLRLAPRIGELLPDAQLPGISVWVQPLPTLYEFPRTTMPEADGFYAPEHRRIHLRESAPDIERTLAHELVHAALGPSWSVLPGTIEEGLCDAISAELVPGSRARLRAGRYCAAAFGLGGLRLDLTIRADGSASADGIDRELHARVRFDGEQRESVDPMRVFDARAGSYSARLSVSRKKALYGYADLLVDRILERRGYRGLHTIALAASERGLEQVPAAWLLAAAQLTPDTDSWQRAILEALGPAELEELVRMQPMLLGEMLVDFLRPLVAGRDPGQLLDATHISIATAAGAARMELLSIPEFRRAVLARLANLPAQESADS